MSEFTQKGVYVFDAEKTFDFAKECNLPIGHIADFIKSIGDGTFVITKNRLKGLCNGKEVPPVFCSEVGELKGVVSVRV